MMSTISTSKSRTKWHPPQLPPPSPEVLHFPRRRRTRRKQTKPTNLHLNTRHRSKSLLLLNRLYLSSSSRGNLENLFDDENDELPKTNGCPVLLLGSNSKPSSVERRDRVEKRKEKCGENSGRGGCNIFAEEKWMFQAEILRAECNLLRMEREFALKKLERNRVKMEKTLRSAVQTLVSGREKIFEGKSVNAVLEKEIEDLSEKLEELHKSSRIKSYEFRNCSNFDKEACFMQRRLEKLGELSDESCLNELQVLAESSLSIDTSGDFGKHIGVSNNKTENKSSEVDELRKKMEEVSNGMLDRVEEGYGSLLSSTAKSSVASSASTSKGTECPNFSCFSTRQLYQEPMLHEDNRCSGRCKAIVHRIVEQVRAETEQWSQMQEMLGQVRGDMEQLQASRDFWENRAHNSDYEIQSLKHAVEQWKEKAHGYEIKANDLQLELYVLGEQLRKSKAELNPEQNREVKLIPDRPRQQLEKEKHVLSCHLKENQQYSYTDEKACKLENAKEELKIEKNKEITPSKDLAPISLGKQLAEEKRILLRRLKEKRHSSEKSCIQEEDVTLDGKPHRESIGAVAPNRSPLRDIGNSSSSSARRKGVVFPFHSTESCRRRESFRK